MDELKPCPFCGENAELRGGKGVASWIICNNKKCRATQGLELTGENAVKMWNTRTAEDALKAEVERLKSRWEKLKDFCEGEEYFSSMFYSGAYRNVLNKIKELGEDTDVTTKESEVKE